jgi:signal transduction histidine kinase
MTMQTINEHETRLKKRTLDLKKINVRKSAVVAIKKSESQHSSLLPELHMLLNVIPDNLLLLSPDLKIMFANKAAASVFGTKISDLKGEYCYSFCCNTFSPCEDCPTLKSFISGSEETSEITTSEGRIWDIRSFPLKDDSGKVNNVIELARDITEKINLQTGSANTRHLSSLGELAAGVAHEINNPVNNIINYAQILIDECEQEKREDDVLRRIIKDGDRIATLTRSLLSFARIRKEEKTSVFLHEIFSDTLPFISAQILKEGILLKVIIPEYIKVQVHHQQIQQVFLNIVSNSRFALNQKYHGTHENKILEITCEKLMVNNSPFVRIVFYDRGTGIPSNIIDKVINPFFSTKPNRVGTGLGLSISHGIIAEHGGKLLISSVAGEYTKIIIDLPAAVKED